MARLLVHRGIVVAIAAAILTGILAGPGGAYQRPGKTALVTVSALTGQPAQPQLSVPALSANGNIVAFQSWADDLVIRDANAIGPDFFVRDMAKQRTELVSVSSQGIQAAPWPLEKWQIWRPALSSSGRFVAYWSTAPNLVPGDTNVCPSEGVPAPCSDIFVHDRKKRTTERVSVSSAGEQSNNASSEPAISDDGRYVAFTSSAPNLVSGDNNETSDVFVHDRKTDKTVRVSVSSKGVEGDKGSRVPDIDSTGRYVAFTSIATTLVENDTNLMSDAFVHDLDTQRTDRVSVATDGTETSIPSEADGVSISRRGRYVTFNSTAGNLIPNDSHPSNALHLYDEVYVRDRLKQRTERVSVTSFGEETIRGASRAPQISDDGRFVTFASPAVNFMPNDNEGLLPGIEGDYDIFVHDRLTGATEPITVDIEGKDGDCADGETLDPLPGVIPSIEPIAGGYALYPAINADGRFVAFGSCDLHLYEGDPRSGSGNWQLFVRDRGLPLAVGGFEMAGQPGTSGGPSYFREYAADPVDDVTRSGLPDADLIGLEVVYRAGYDDLLITLPIVTMSGARGIGAATMAGDPRILDSVRLAVGSSIYEVRIAQTGSTGDPGQPVFGLFRCDGPVCSEVAHLRGGYGATGDEVVAAVPMARLGVDSIAELTSIRAETSLGSYLTGAIQVLDALTMTLSGRGGQDRQAAQGATTQAAQG